MARVSVTNTNNIAIVTLTRGDKMNALDPDMIDAIIAAGHKVAASDARAVVLQGEGKSFCAGLDVASFAAFAAGQDPHDMIVPRTHDDANRWQEVTLVWRRVNVPVIAALHGVVYGGGMQIAMGADIRIAAPDTKLSIMEMKWGLVPDMGGMLLFRDHMRSDVLRQMIYTAAPVTAQQAERWGLVTHLADNPQAAALDLATEIAGKSPSAIRAAKRLIDVAEDHSSTRQHVLLEESREQASLIGKPDQMETVMAQMQKRAADYK
jgi:enoyl-CoA hydratase/carnithine racemase